MQSKCKKCISLERKIASYPVDPEPLKSVINFVNLYEIDDLKKQLITPETQEDRFIEELTVNWL